MLSLPGGLLQVLYTILDVYSFILIARVLLSWIQPNSTNRFVVQSIQFIYQVTEPVLAPLRQVIPPIGGLDLSVLVVFFGIRILQGFLF